MVDTDPLTAPKGVAPPLKTHDGPAGDPSSGYDEPIDGQEADEGRSKLFR